MNIIIQHLDLQNNIQKRIQTILQRIIYHFFEISYSLAWIKAFGTCITAIHNGFTLIQFCSIVQELQSFLGCSITRILYPSVSLHKNSWT